MDRKFLQIRSFTIIELIAVISIIGILVGIGIGLRQIGGISASEAATESTMVIVEQILNDFKKDRGYFPQSLEQGRLTTRMADDNNFDLLKDLSGKSTNKYIANITELKNKNILIEDSTSSEETYIFRDGFGNNFMYRCPGKFNISSYDLWSVGADQISDIDLNNKNDLGGNSEKLEEDEKNVNLDNIKNWE